MSRIQKASGEKPLFWIGSSLGDLLSFPEAVKDEAGAALSVAQFGGKHPSAKLWKGSGAGVFEIVEDHRGNTYRVIYTVKFAEAYMSSTHFKRNRRPESRHAEVMWN
jgi:phage-related protein